MFYRPPNQQRTKNSARLTDQRGARHLYRIMELSLLRTFAPGSESTMVWNFRSLELSLPGTFAPWNFRSRERKFQELSLQGIFAPWNFRSRVRKFQELSLPRQVTFGHKRRLMEAIAPTAKKLWRRCPQVAHSNFNDFTENQLTKFREFFHRVGCFR